MKIVSFVKLDRFNEKLDDGKALILAGALLNKSNFC